MYFCTVETNEQKPDFSEVLEVASEAGHILLENGAELSRVEDIMNRISTHFGVSSGHFFILSLCRSFLSGRIIVSFLLHTYYSLRYAVFFVKHGGKIIKTEE